MTGMQADMLIFIAGFAAGYAVYHFYSIDPENEEVAAE